MNVIVTRENNRFHFIAKNSSGNQVHIDANTAIGGENKGVRPMEMLLMALGGCSGIDIVSILKKQRCEEFNLLIDINAQREQSKEPALFEMIEVQFIFSGNLDKEKVKRAVDLSMQKYCSVAKTLEKTATINYAIKLNNNIL